MTGTAKQLFPFIIYGRENWSPPLLKVFLANKPKDRSWYIIDVQVNSPTQVLFIVSGMHCNVYGGRGTEEYRVKVNNVDKDLVMPLIKTRALTLGAQMYEEEQERLARAGAMRYAVNIVESNSLIWR